MTDADLDLAVARTRHERFRWLTSDANPDPESRAGYRAFVRALAAGPWPPEPAPAPPPPEVELLRSLFCPHQRLAGCACGKPYECAPSGRHPGRKLTAEECNACLARERRDGA